jgi:hypothetical protein
MGQVSRTMQEVQRPLLTDDECLRMPGPKKDSKVRLPRRGYGRLRRRLPGHLWRTASVLPRPDIHRARPSRNQRTPTGCACKTNLRLRRPLPYDYAQGPSDRRRYHPRCKYWRGVVAGGIYAAGGRFNTSKSLELGLYWITDAPITKGAYVMFCPPERKVFVDAKERGYIDAGFCPETSAT